MPSLFAITSEESCAICHLLPPFFYFNRVYREWQQNSSSRGNQFNGLHRGVQVNADTVMEPFGRTAGGILNGISECVTYSGGLGTVSRQATSGNSGNVSSARIGYIGLNVGSVDSGTREQADKIPKISKSETEALILKAAKEKTTRPRAYSFKVKAAVDLKEATLAACRKFGTPQDVVEAFERCYSLVKLAQGGVDMTDKNKSEAEIVAKGKQEIELIAEGKGARRATNVEDKVETLD